MAHVNRRDFMRRTAGGFTMAGTAAAVSGYGRELQFSPKREHKGEHSMNELDLSSVPNFCSHEHWGSINAIGMAPEGFRADTEAGATPSRRTSVWDVVLDPYLGGWVAIAGANWPGMARDAGYEDIVSWWDAKPSEMLAAMRPHLEHQLFTGVFQCIRRGILLLHGADIAALDVDEWQRADEAISASYGDMFSWYRRAMAKAHFTELIRPVHPEFYARKQSAETAEQELSFTHTILRIDPLLELWKAQSPRRDALADLTGVEPRDASTWRSFITRLFDLAAEHRTTGIKQLQAYTRTLAFTPRADAEVKWAGNLAEEEVLVFQDWVMHECCKQAHERNWPHQVHVGTHNLGPSNPLPLEALARRYPQMKLVMLHCWPYLREAGYIAKYTSNGYIDTCWVPVLNPQYFQEALAGWLNFVPGHKIMCAHDSTSIEMAVGSSLFTRELLAAALSRYAAPLAKENRNLEQIANNLLNNNAVALYGIGEAAPA
jgi:predicted TIM-barrel fold metal-dependent hydrolase